MSGLVATAWLEQRLGDDDLTIIEVSADPRESAAYFSGHIPGARYAYWKDLCWHDTDRDFPAPDVMAERLGRLGVDDDTTIVVVGDPVQFGAYAYWVLTMTGFAERTVLLDGGRLAWSAEQRPTTTEIITPEPATVSPGAVAIASRIGRDAVRAGLDVPERVLVDMRSPEEYTGERVAPAFIEFDHGAHRYGRIPGARHLHYSRLLTDTGTLRPTAELRSEFESEGVTPDREVVTYCRLSHRASMGWFVLTEMLGYPDVKVYDGSWTEWGSIVGFPVER